MSIIPTTSSKIKKMKITGYKDMACGQAIGFIELQVNPEKLELEYKLTHPNNADRTTNTDPVSTGDSTYDLPNLSIDTVLDNTGVMSSELKGKDGKKLKGNTAINDYIKDLKEIVYNYIQATHGPPYVQISWGTLVVESTHLAGSNNKATFTGQLESMKISYELFSADGDPVRAKISMSFAAMHDDAFRPSGQSPDLTHIHQVQMGDNLPALSQHIYSDPNFYIQLARVNGLSSLYGLKPGAQLVIPPLEKSSR